MKKPNNAPISVIYMDDFFIAIHKPAELLSVPAKDRTLPNAYDAVAARFGEVHIAHRLDAATSGVLLFARTRAMLSAVQTQWRAQTVAKTYIALVRGCVRSPTAQPITLTYPIRADWPNRPRQLVDAVRGKPSVTLLRILRAHRQYTRVILTPKTGRTHQLRVHLAAFGYPILGDALYAENGGRGFARLFLHAHRLTFTHPILGAPIHLTAPLPF